MTLCTELVFNPSKLKSTNTNLKCCDNKLHIKLKNYSKPTIIYGLEQKLSLLLTYYLTIYLKDKETTFKGKSFTEIINNFKTSKEYNDLEIPNITILQFYNSKGENKFGYIKPELMSNILNIIQQINLKEFLFTDQYYLKISKVSNKEESKAYSKFIKKELKKTNKQNISEDISKKYIPLW